MKYPRSFKNRPLLVGLIGFFLMLFLTQTLIFQQYQLRKDKEQKKATLTAYDVQDRIEKTLNYSFAAAKTLAFIVERNGEPSDFDTLAHSLLHSNRAIDALQLTRKGTIIKTYPLMGNEAVIGYDILADSARNKEALKAIEKKDMYYSGPFELRQGGLGIVGRQPIFINKEFWGFAAVIIRFSTLLTESGINNSDSNEYVFELSKINPNNNKEEFFLKSSANIKKGNYTTVRLPDGDWNLYAQPLKSTSYRDFLPQALLGVVLSIVTAILGWDRTRRPQKLQQQVNEQVQKLSESQNNYRNLLESISDAFVALDKNWCYTYMNKKAGQIFNRDPDKMTGKHIWTEFPEGVGQPFQLIYEKAFKEQEYIYFEEYYPPYDQWFENHIYPTDNGIAIFFRDVTDRKKNEIKILKMSRLYDFSRQVNQVIIDVTNEQALFKSICDVAVSIGKFKMAWMGMINDELHTVDPVSFSGEERGYLVQIKKITTDNIREGKGPTGTALREGRTVVCNDIETDPRMELWRNDALERGYRSSISLPVKKLERLVGSLSLYAPDKNFFDQEELEMLEQIAANISFSLDNYEKEKLRRQAEIALKTNETFIRSLINASPDIIYIYDFVENKIVYVNEGLQKVLGYSEDEVKEMGENVIPKLMHPDDLNYYQMNTYPGYQHLKDEQLIEHEYRIKDKSGKWRWILTKESIYKRSADNSPCQIFGVGTDVTLRKTAEEEIAYKTKILEQAEEKAMLGSWEFEVAKQQWHWSKQMFRFFNIPENEVPADFSKYFGLIHPEDRQMAITAFTNMTNGREPGIQLFRTNPENSELRYLKISWNAEKDNQGRIVNFWGNLLDVTQTYLNEKQILGEKEIADTIINSLPGVFYLYNKQGKFFRWNKNFETVSDYTAAEIEKMHPLDFFDASQKELLTQKINNVFLTGSDYVEADFVSRSGKKNPYYFTGSLIDYYGETCLMGVGIDISERVAVEQKLEETATELSVSEKKYRTLFESSPLPMWIYTLDDLRIIDVNNAAIKHYGYSREEFLRMTIKDVRPEEDIPLLMETLKVIGKGNGSIEKYFRHKKKDGTVIRVEIKWHDTVFNNKPVRLALIIDVTEKLLMDEKIKESLEAVRRLTAHLQSIREEERKRISREIHDELGQQLTAIKMDIAWIDKKTPAIGDELKQKMKNIISLLDSSNLSIRKILNELRMGILEHQTIDEALKWLAHQFSDNTGIPLEFIYPQPITISNEAIATCLFRVYQESLTNITRYAKAKKVTTRLTKDQGFVRLIVQDDGIGFNPSDLNEARSFGILGMKERVASLQGAFELVSSPGKGTRIEIKIPLKLV